MLQVSSPRVRLKARKIYYLGREIRRMRLPQRQRLPCSLLESDRPTDGLKKIEQGLLNQRQLIREIYPPKNSRPAMGQSY